MVCLAFHNPADFKQVLDASRYEIHTLFTEDDFKALKLKKTDKTRVIITNSIKKLKDFVKSNDFDEKIKKFKVVVFDTPHNFFVNKYLIEDATNRTDGIWAFKAVNSINFAPLIDSTGWGLKAKKIKGE